MNRGTKIRSLRRQATYPLDGTLADLRAAGGTSVFNEDFYSSQFNGSYPRALPSKVGCASPARASSRRSLRHSTFRDIVVWSWGRE